MSLGKKENPVFASEYIPYFVNIEGIDGILLKNLQFEQKEEILVSLLPIVDHVAETKLGIVRIFLSNSGDLPIELYVSYNISGWFSDLNKLENAKSLEKVIVKPKEVLVRDIEFKSSIKQGKNYFQIILTRRKSKSKKEVYTHHIEYSQIRAIDEKKQIERSNFLGMSSKAYINPFAINYWIFYSLFGSNKYRKDNIFFIIIKSIFLLSGIILTALSFFLDVFTNLDYILPIGIIVTIISFMSYFFMVDRKKMNLIIHFDLTTSKTKGSLRFLKTTSSERLSIFCLSDINYSYDSEKDIMRWKDGANKLYQKIIPEINGVLGLENIIQPAIITKSRVSKEISDKEKLGQDIERGIQFHKDEGIDFENTIQSVAQDAKGVPTDSLGMTSETSVIPEVKEIIVDSEVKLEIEPIQAKESVHPIIEPITSRTSVDPVISPIETKTKGLDSSGKNIDLETIPTPQKIPREKDSTFKSVRAKNEQEED